MEYAGNTEKQIGPAKLNGRTVLQRKTTRKTRSQAAENCACEYFLAAATEAGRTTSTNHKETESGRSWFLEIEANRTTQRAQI
jgi:hypothetical protein